MELKIISKNTAPLCFMPNGCLICYQYGNIVILEKGQEIKKFPLFKSIKERILGRSKLISRFLRLGIRSAVTLDDSLIIFSIGNIIYELNVDTCVLSKGYNCGEGIRPLTFSTVKGVEGVDDGIYFGGYLQNKEKKPVNIYYRVGVDQWQVVHTFNQGEINHVHNIVPDPYRQCLWVFTGDFDEASAIWKVTDNFKKVERVAYNNQKYRGCVVYALSEGLLYATDAPFTDDYIYLLNTETMETKEVFPIHGSCIYGCKWKDKFVFSSTVEGDGFDTTKWQLYFGCKRGKGIKDEFVHMYIGDLKEGFKEVYKEKKDCLPFYFFQFGVFKFPNNENLTDTLYFQSFATRKNDLRLTCFKES